MYPARYTIFNMNVDREDEMETIKQIIKQLNKIGYSAELVIGVDGGIRLRYYATIDQIIKAKDLLEKYGFEFHRVQADRDHILISASGFLKYKLFLIDEPNVRRIIISRDTMYVEIYREYYASRLNWLEKTIDKVSKLMDKFGFEPVDIIYHDKVVGFQGFRRR